ncbi:MAG: U32 family peptidase [Lentisphaeria bacterium]|nr:U32 family peptidase [Lentisphaeria bacterium]
MKRYRPELLAPAGDAAGVSAAIAAGGDAVYVGLKQFGLRGGAGHFTLAGLARASRQCREHGVRLYLTLNTQVYERELPRLDRLVTRVAPLVDAVIAWDPAVLASCRRHGVAVHLSTQGSVANTAAAELYRSLGVSRIVLARECTLAEARLIQARSGVEVEVFAHGAMCVSISGRCFMSYDSYGRSGNRGECVQNCRQAYHVVAADGPGEYLVEGQQVFSARDLCTLPFLDQVLAAGVSALKIEGRNRPADYVATVVGAYREAIDAWRDNRLTEAVKAELTERCRRVFNRGFSEGFYLGRPIQSFTEHENNQATERRELAGTVLNYYRRAGVVRVWLRHRPVAVGDSLVIMGPTTGVVRGQVEQLRTEEDAQRRPPLTATMPFPARVRAGDQVYVVTGASSAPRQAEGRGGSP